MRRAFLIGLAGVLMTLAAPPAQASPEAAMDAALARYVSTDATGLNRVDYASWTANRADHDALHVYIATLTAQRPSQMPRAERFVYWVNLYNAVTLDVILENYPVTSIRNLRTKALAFSVGDFLGPWKAKLVTVEGVKLSLDDIEHKTLRPQFADPRVHYAVNCASVGCPNLRKSLWRPETLEADLDAAASAFINSDRGLEVRDGGRAIRLSSIYQWFAKDFGDAKGLRAHLARYATGQRAAALKAGARIAGYQYDWSLNGGGGAFK
jgi:hypothetical protein